MRAASALLLALLAAGSLAYLALTSARRARAAATRHSWQQTPRDAVRRAVAAAANGRVQDTEAAIQEAVHTRMAM